MATDRDAHDGPTEGRGREAGTPREIPPSGWRDILLRVKGELSRDHVSVVAAGVAFYAFVAIFPAIAALISLYGLVADPRQAGDQIMSLAGTLPGEVRSILTEEMGRIAGQPGGTLSLGLLVGLMLALWSAHQGMGSLFEALDIAYGEEEKRGFFKFNALTLLFTLGAILLVLVALGLVVGLPIALGFVGLSSIAETLVSVLRWPLLASFVLLGLSLIYRYGPSRATPRWRWVTWGSVVAAALWIGGSALFSFYVSRFASYNKTYGSMAAVVILLLWFYLSAYSVLLGAEINAEMEHQTKQDTTTGQPKPLGGRGARVADTVGQTP